MQRPRVTVTLDERVLDKINEARGRMPLSTYLNHVLGVIYGVYSPDTLKETPEYPKFMMDLTKAAIEVFRGDLESDIEELRKLNREKERIKIDGPGATQETNP